MFTGSISVKKHTCFLQLLSTQTSLIKNTMGINILYMLGITCHTATVIFLWIKKHFSKKIMPFETPIRGVYLANMQQVYPWDRGTNFAVEMGERVVQHIESQNKKK